MVFACELSMPMYSQLLLPRQDTDCSQRFTPKTELSLPLRLRNHDELDSRRPKRYDGPTLFLSGQEAHHTGSVVFARAGLYSAGNAFCIPAHRQPFGLRRNTTIGPEWAQRRRATQSQQTATACASNAPCVSLHTYVNALHDKLDSRRRRADQNGTTDQPWGPSP